MFLKIRRLHSAKHLQMAKSLGMTTILVRHEGEGDTYADYCVSNVLEGCSVVRKLCN